MTVLLPGCQVMEEGSTLAPGFYRLRRASAYALPPQSLYVTDAADTLRLRVPETTTIRTLLPTAYDGLTLYRKHVDVDVFTIPFKVRPAQAGIPAQLNSNFNAALYLGRRIDFYQFSNQRVTPDFQTRRLRSRGFGYGVFAGIGSAVINDLVLPTRKPGFEYEGVVIDLGAALIYDARLFNVGLAVGADHLLDANRHYWVYQQRPWFGILFGLNLN